MGIIADTCWTEGLGVDNVTGQPGIKNLRHLAWPYTASIATATGLYLDPASGFPWAHPVDGVIQTSVQSNGRSFASDPGTAGVSMIVGGTPYLSPPPLINTTHRYCLVILFTYYDFRFVLTEQSSFTANDNQYIAPITTIAMNTAPADPGTDAGTQSFAEVIGGIVTAGFGGATARGGRRTNITGIGFLAPGDSYQMKHTVAFNRGSGGYTAGAYDLRIVYNTAAYLIGWPQAPAS